MTASAHIVTVGAMPSPGADGAAVAAALGAAGVNVVSRVFVEDDESALERALGSDEALTVVLAGGGGSAGDIVPRARAGDGRAPRPQRPAPHHAPGALSPARSPVAATRRAAGALAPG